MTPIPLYLIALIVAIANTPLNIFDVHAWNVGTVHAEPWRKRLSVAATRITSAFARLVDFLWPHRQQLAAIACALLVLALAPSGLQAHGVSICVVGSLQEQFEAAREQVLVLKSRNVDPATLSAAVNKALDLKRRIANAQDGDSMMAELGRLTEGMGSSRSHGGGRSLGAAFVNSDTFKWLKQHKGGLPTGTWTSVSSELPGLNLMAATLTEDAASGGDLVIQDFRPGILALPTRPLVMADLIAPGTTESNTVVYMKETSFTNAADTVAEGVAKPESTLIFDAVSDPVRKIATWIPVTEEMLEDVPALQSYIDTRLRLGVQLAEDDQLLNGSVVAPDIIGFLARTGLAASIARVAEVNADAIYSQIAAIETATGLAVDGIVMNPSNWKTIQLLKDSTGNYIGGGGPFASPRVPTLWGRPVALTSAIVANTALVGAFRTASQIFRKGGLRVEASNSHASFFTENKVAIRAEERLALAVYRASAFGTVTNLS
jgi:HK97 family phage major capsid protein